MDKIKSLKVKQADGTLGQAIALGADATNVDLANGSNVETAITTLKNNEIFVMKKSYMASYQGRTHAFIFYNQDIIDLVNFCKEHQGSRNLNSAESFNISTYPPFSVIMNVQTDIIHNNLLFSVFYFEGNDIANTFGYQNVFYFDCQDVFGSAMEQSKICRFMESLLVFGVTDSIKNNPTGYTEFKTFQEEGVVQGYGNWFSLAQKDQVYSKDEVNSLIGNLSSLNIEVVTTLPTSNISSSTIYLVARENGDTQNIYEEYIYVNNKWEMIGTTEIDTSSFDEVHVGSDTPTAESVEVWIDPNGEASEGNADAYTKTETDAKIAEAMYNVNNIIKLDSSLGSTTLKPILKHIVDTIEENEKEAPLVTVINSNNSTSKHVVYGYSNKYTDGAYTNYKFNGTTEVGYSSETAKGSYVKRSEYYLTIMYNPSTDTYSFTPGKSTYNSDTFLPTGNQNVSGFTPTYAYHPATKKYVDEYSYSKAEIDAKFTALANQYVKQVNGTTTALWMGTKAQYDAITTKDATTTYIIQGEE